MTLDLPITVLKGAGEQLAEKFAKLEIHTLRELITTFPRYYLDYSKQVTLAELIPDKKQTVIAEVLSFKNRYIRGRGGRTLQQAVLRDSSGDVPAVWFNMPFLETSLIPGQKYAFTAQLSRNKLNFKPQLVAPGFEKYSEDGNLVHSGRIVPVYSLTERLSPKIYRRLILQILESEDLLKELNEEIPEPILSQIKTKVEFLDLRTALREMHFPTSFERLAAAKFRLGVEELLPIQQKLLLQNKLRQQAKTLTDSSSIAQSKDQYLAEFWQKFPFEPTPDQSKAN